MSDQNLKEFHDTLKGHVCEGAKSYYRMGASKPDVWFEPKQVRFCAAGSLVKSNVTANARQSVPAYNCALRESLADHSVWFPALCRSGRLRRLICQYHRPTTPPLDWYAQCPLYGLGSLLRAASRTVRLLLLTRLVPLCHRRPWQTRFLDVCKCR